jgi:hypothetical protein
MASASSEEFDRDSLSWPLSATPGKSFELEEADAVRSQPKSTIRTSLPQGLPLELFSSRHSNYRDSWILCARDSHGDLCLALY